MFCFDFTSANLNADFARFSLSLTPLSPALFVTLSLSLAFIPFCTLRRPLYLNFLLQVRQRTFWSGHSWAIWCELTQAYCSIAIVVVKPNPSVCSMCSNDRATKHVSESMCCLSLRRIEIFRRKKMDVVSAGRTTPDRCVEMFLIYSRITLRQASNRRHRDGVESLHLRFVTTFIHDSKHIGNFAVFPALNGG